MVGPFLAPYLRIWLFFGYFWTRFGPLAKSRSGNPGGGWLFYLAFARLPSETRPSACVKNMPTSQRAVTKVCANSMFTVLHCNHVVGSVSNVSRIVIYLLLLVRRACIRTYRHMTYANTNEWPTYVICNIVLVCLFVNSLACVIIGVRLLKAVAMTDENMP